MSHIVPAMVLGAALLSTALPGHAGEESIRLSEAPGREATTTHCGICHSLDYIEMNAPVMNAAAWDKTVRKMTDRFGAPVSDAQAREIVDYLAAQYAHAR